MTGTGGSRVHGVLGAAHVAPMALVNPAKHNSEVVVTAVAVRDAGRAQRGMPLCQPS